MYSVKFEEAISNLKADNISGSEEIVRKALQIVDEEIESAPEKYTNLGELTEMLAQVMTIKREMFALRNVLVYFIDFYYQNVPLSEVADRVLDKLDEELRELEEARSSSEEASLTQEVGDLLFAVVNLARHLGVDPELALQSTNRKFTERFHYIEARLAEQDRSPADSSMEELESLWQEAKTVISKQSSVNSQKKKNT